MACQSNRRLDNAVAAFIADPSSLYTVGALGDGNINDTYLITCASRSPVVLQRINPVVFPNPETVVGNGAILARHLASAADIVTRAGYRFPHHVQTLTGEDWYRDGEGEIWRCQTFIENSLSYSVVSNTTSVYEAGKLLGFFHRALASMDHRELGVSLPGFHDLGKYRDHYIAAVREHRRPVTPQLEYCRMMTEDRLETDTLDELARAGGVESRVIHGDPKCVNFLFDADSGRAMALIDLDTAAPGLSVVDLGDCLRSFCNPGGESNRGTVSFDIDLCRTLVEGYRSEGTLSEPEELLVYHGVRLLTYELGIRFLTDYLENNRYFKVADDEENLRRAVVQFMLLESIEEQQRAVDAIALR